jgi:hypothetical protein
MEKELSEYTREEIKDAILVCDLSRVQWSTKKRQLEGQIRLLDIELKDADKKYNSLIQASKILTGLLQKTPKPKNDEQPE